MKLKDYVESQRGAAARLSRALDVAPATMHEWVHGESQVPMVRCIEIEQKTDGAVRCEDLRPDLSGHWSYIRGTQSQEPVNA